MAVAGGAPVPTRRTAYSGIQCTRTTAACPRRIRVPCTSRASLRRGAVHVPQSVAQQATASAKDEEVAPATSKAPHDPRMGYANTILLQGFGWESHKHKPWYTKVKGKINDIKDAGFTHIWLPPPSQSVSAEGYLPGQLYNLSSAYGNQEELESLLSALKAAGVKALADIVINHRCADEQKDGVYNQFRDDVDHHGKKIDWGQWAITSDDPHFHGHGNPDTGEDFGAAPDLDHANADLRHALCDWLAWLKTDVGFEGWRFDYVKGYGAKFIKEYVDASTKETSFNVGELWPDLVWEDGKLAYNQDAGRQRIVDWIDGGRKRSTAFDFVTKGVLAQAVQHCEYWRLQDSNGKAPGVIGWWPKMSVTFIDNHDTGSSQAHWPFPSEQVASGYAYILTHPGLPCVFWEHFFDWGSHMRKEILDLIKLRRRAGIISNSELEILRAQDDMYIAKIADKVVLKIGPGMDMGPLVPKKSDGWKLALSGKNYAIWEKS